MQGKTETYPLVIFHLREELYGLSTQFIRTMVALPEVSEVPGAPAWVRGVVNLRGQVTPLVDLRVRLGMESFLERTSAMVAMMHEREQDHRSWLQELERSVAENRKFTLATDPHKCKFGQWYDSYQPKTESEARFLKKFTEPHARIHGLAVTVEEAVAQGKFAEANALIEKTREQELAEMIKLFELFRQEIKRTSRQEIIIVLKYGNKRTAIAVDSIIGVERIPPDSIAPMSEVLGHPKEAFVQYLGKREKTGDIVYILDEEKLIDGNCVIIKSA